MPGAARLPDGSPRALLPVPGALHVLDVPAVRRWALLTRSVFAARRVEIDALNVFPVPDGDTGTNLFLTFDGAVERMLAARPARRRRPARRLRQGAVVDRPGQLRSHPQPARARARRGLCRRRRRRRPAARPRRSCGPSSGRAGGHRPARRAPSSRGQRHGDRVPPRPPGRRRPVPRRGCMPSRWRRSRPPGSRSSALPSSSRCSRARASSMPGAPASSSCSSASNASAPASAAGRAATTRRVVEDGSGPSTSGPRSTRPPGPTRPPRPRPTTRTRPSYEVMYLLADSDEEAVDRAAGPSRRAR